MAPPAALTAPPLGHHRRAIVSSNPRNAGAGPHVRVMGRNGKPIAPDHSRQPRSRTKHNSSSASQRTPSCARDEDQVRGAARRALPYRPARASVCRSSAGAPRSRPKRHCGCSPRTRPLSRGSGSITRVWLLRRHPVSGSNGADRSSHSHRYLLCECVVSSAREASRLRRRIQ